MSTYSLRECALCGVPHVPDDLRDRVNAGEEIDIEIIYGSGVAGNTLKHGCGGLNIDACRVETEGRPAREVAECRDGVTYNRNSLAGRVNGSLQSSKAVGTTTEGRWPANVVLSDDPEVEEAFARFGESTSPSKPVRQGGHHRHDVGLTGASREGFGVGFGDTGSASRFFYTAKADTADRAGSKHPTVKPLSLMSWLVRLVTPPGGIVLDPFAGTGSTGLAADHLGMNAVLIERDPVYAADAKRKIEQGAGLFASVQTESRLSVSPLPQSDLFSEVA